MRGTWSKLRRYLSALMVLTTLALAMHASLSASAEVADPDAGSPSVQHATVPNAGPSLPGSPGRGPLADLAHATQHPKDHGSAPCRSACCGPGSACMVGLPVTEAAPLALQSAKALRHAVHDVSGEDFDPAGLRRPPNA